MGDNLTKQEIEDVISTDFVPVMELAGNLALERHEGMPISFAFLVGTDVVWPAIAEELSADFEVYDYRLYPQIELVEEKLKIKLMKTLCKSNYSIFQIFGTAGFYNIGSGKFVNIVRLSQPSEMETEEKVVDLDDLFCFAVKKIWKFAPREKPIPIIVSTQGDGKVRVYAFEKAKNDGDLLFLWDVTNGDVYRPISKSVVSAVKRIFNKNESTALLKIIRKISTMVGEGAMLIVVRKGEIVNKFLSTLEYFKPEWQENLSLTGPKELLRAALIMDGATLIIKGPNTKIEPRYAVYPFEEKAYSLLRDLFEHFGNQADQRRIVKKLSGKGTKTHVAANLSHLLKMQEIKIITISADGPIKLWPDELNNNDK